MMHWLRCTACGGLFAVIMALALAGCSDDDSSGNNNTNNQNNNNGGVLTCAESCPLVVAANCTNGPPNAAECETGCNEAQTVCPSEFAGVQNCAGADPTMTCDASGMPFPEGCQTEHDFLQGCLADQQLTCDDICPMMVASGCANAPTNVTTCVTYCNASEEHCPTEFHDLHDCMGLTPTFICDANDRPIPQGCQTESDAMLTCLANSRLSCADTCPRVIAAFCSNGPSNVTNCITGCERAAIECPSEFDAVGACAGLNPTFTCDASDMPYPQGCQAEQDALMFCLNADQLACAEICPLVVAAGCSNGPPDVPSCETGCNTAASNCPSEFDAVYACAGLTPTFTCDASDMPYPVGCQAEQVALMDCLSFTP